MKFIKFEFQMRRILFLLSIFSLLFSCRKSYTCECTADDPIHNVDFTTTMTRSAAEDWCREWHNDLTTDDEEVKKGWRCVLREN